MGMGNDLFTVFCKGNNRYHLFCLEVVVVGIGVMVSVTTKDANVYLEAIFPGSLEKSVKVFDRKCVVALITTRHMGMQREIMAILMYNDMVVAVTKQKAFPIGIIAPGSRRAGVEAVMLTLVYPFGSTLTSGFAVGRGSAL
jgi:hypothetical protein